VSLLPVDAARARLFALAPAMAEENAPLIEAAGRWSARDVHARRTQPVADLSSMDGYAIRFAELPGPWRVIGESAAGSGLGRALAPGEAARIFTGAPVPEGADAILIQEEAARDGAMLTLAGEGPPERGAHIRVAGNDFREGDRLIAAGDLLSAPRIGLAGTGGHGTLPVRRRPRVALISTGDELVRPGEPTPGVMLPSANAPMLAALIGTHVPAIVTDQGIVRDDLEAITSAFADAATRADVIVTTGGASVGDHDLVRPALERAGATIDFWRIAMRPGKPLLAGRLGDAVVLGLPGNPVSAFVTAWLFLLPLLRHMLDAADPLPRTGTGVLAAPLPAVGERADYLRGRRTAAGIIEAGSQDSAMLATLAAAELLILRPARSAPAMAGDSVEILDLA
jgi:molybdopterin molybdotransferase